MCEAHGGKQENCKLTLFIFYVSGGILHKVIQLIQYTLCVCWYVFFYSSNHIFNILSDLVSSKYFTSEF